LAGSVELSREEWALVLEALEEAAFYRDSRSRVVRSAARRSDRGLARKADAGGTDRRKARMFEALALKLKRELIS